MWPFFPKMCFNPFRTQRFAPRSQEQPPRVRPEAPSGKTEQLKMIHFENYVILKILRVTLSMKEHTHTHSSKCHPRILVSEEASLFK